MEREVFEMSSELICKLLPTTLIINGFVEGNPDSNYEKYLVEFINSSDFFLDKSNGELYTPPQSEAHGECDCISKSYQLDLKMLISKSMAQGKNLFSMSIDQSIPCMTMYGCPKILPTNKNYKPIKATILHTWFRETTVDKLYEIENSSDTTEKAYDDIRSMLKAINKKKNILCMLPYEYDYNDEEEYNSQEIQVVETISRDFKSLVQYRMIVQPEYDTYISFVYKDNLIILQFTETEVLPVDKIPLSKSEIFQQLKSISKSF